MKTTFLVFLALLLIPMMTQATLFTVTNQGVDFNLTITPVGADLYNLALVVDTIGYSGSAVSLHGIGLKVSSDITVPTDFVLRGPHPSGVASWELKAGQINANSTFPKGNAVGSGSGWFSELFLGNGGLGLAGGGGFFTFNWQINESLKSEPFSVKAIFVDSKGKKKGEITSEDFASASPIPEPSTLILFGVGALGVISYGFRQWKRNLKEK